MDIVKSKAKIKSLFNSSESSNVVDQTFLLNDAKEEFLSSLNESFGEDGIYFEALETKIEIKGQKPCHALPMFSVHHKRSRDALGVLDAKNKTLTLNIESRIQNLDNQIYDLKQTIIEMNKQVSALEDTLKSKKWNVFVQLFQRRKIKRLEANINNIKSDLVRNQKNIYSNQKLLQAEQDIANVFDMLSSQLLELGIEVTNN